MNHYLSEVFLDNLEEDYSATSVHAALKACENELNQRLDRIPSSIGKGLYFLETDGAGFRKRNSIYGEILDFWDVMREFDGEEFDQYEIVRLARNMYSMR